MVEDVEETGYDSREEDESDDKKGEPEAAGAAASPTTLAPSRGRELGAVGSSVLLDLVGLKGGTGGSAIDGSIAVDGTRRSTGIGRLRCLHLSPSLPQSESQSSGNCGRIIKISYKFSLRRCLLFGKERLDLTNFLLILVDAGG